MGNLSHTTGSVNIGTSTPVANTPLLVQGVGDGIGTIRLQIAGSGGSLNYGSMVVSGTQSSGTIESKWINSFVIEGVPNADSTGASGSTIISSYERDLRFHTGTRAERMRITTSGDVGIGTNAPTTKLDVNGGVKISGVLNVNEISGFTASGGIRFPPTAVNSADVNTLDDYEEGTWTPSLTFGGGTPTTLTYNTAAGGAYARSGVYVKIGRLVWCHGRIQLSALSGAAVGGLVRITGLPFNASYPTSVHPVGVVPYYTNLAAAITTPPGLYFDASDTIRFVKNSGGTIVSMVSADFTAATDIMFSIVYGV